MKYLGQLVHTAKHFIHSVSMVICSWWKELHQSTTRQKIQNKYETKIQTNTKPNYKQKQRELQHCTKSKASIAHYQQIQQSLCLTTWKFSDPTPLLSNLLVRSESWKISIFYCDNCDCVKSMRRYEGNLKSWMINMHQEQWYLTALWFSRPLIMALTVTIIWSTGIIFNIWNNPDLLVIVHHGAVCERQIRGTRLELRAEKWDEGWNCWITKHAEKFKSAFAPRVNPNLTSDRCPMQFLDNFMVKR